MRFTNISTKLRTAGNSFLRLLYPLRCPCCDRPIKGSHEKICLSCLPKMRLLTPPWCMTCGKKVEEGEQLCKDCREREHSFTRGRALYDYSAAASSIFRFKYAGRREYAEFYAEQICEYLGDFLATVKPDAIIPIPLHDSRKVKRGYNQAEVLARAIGRRTGIPVRNYLKRAKNTRPLKQLTPAERQNNLKNAFIIPENDVKLRITILIDDIYTTGATIDEASRTLLQAGCEKVYFLSLACGAGV